MFSNQLIHSIENLFVNNNVAQHTTNIITQKQNLSLFKKTKIPLESTHWTTSQIREFLKYHRFDRFNEVFLPSDKDKEKKRNENDLTTSIFEKDANTMTATVSQIPKSSIFELLSTPEGSPIRVFWDYDHFLYNFLIVYPLFMTSQELLEGLMTKWNEVVPSVDGLDFNVKCSILFVMREWLRLPKTQEFLDTSLFTTFSKFLSMSSSPSVSPAVPTKASRDTDSSSSNNLKPPDSSAFSLNKKRSTKSLSHSSFTYGGLSYLSSIKENMEKVLMARHSPQTTDKSSQFLNDLLPPSIIPENWDQVTLKFVSHIELARQLTLIEADLCNKVIRDDFLCYSKLNQKKTSSPSSYFLNLMKHSEDIISWVATQILSHYTTQGRTEILSLFINCMEHLEVLNNFNSLNHVLMSLQSQSITKLKSSWNLLPKREREKFDYYSQLMSSNHQYKDYFDKLNNIDSDVPCIPLISVILTELQRSNDVMDINDTYGWLNWKKMSTVAERISHFVRFGHTRYNLKEVPSIQKLILEGEKWELGDITKEIANLREKSHTKEVSLLGHIQYSRTEDLWTKFKITDEDWGILLSGSRVMNYKAGNIILRKGKHNKYLFKIKSKGKAAVVTDSLDGIVGEFIPDVDKRDDDLDFMSFIALDPKEQKKIVEDEISLANIVHNPKNIVGKLGEGDIFGEISMILKERTTATIIALTDVEVYAINKDNLKDLCKHQPLLEWKLFFHIAIQLSNHLKKVSNPEYFNRNKVLDILESSSTSSQPQSAETTPLLNIKVVAPELKLSSSSNGMKRSLSGPSLTSPREGQPAETVNPIATSRKMVLERTKSTKSPKSKKKARSLSTETETNVVKKVRSEKNSSGSPNSSKRKKPPTESSEQSQTPPTPHAPQTTQTRTSSSPSRSERKNEIKLNLSSPQLESDKAVIVPVASSDLITSARPHTNTESISAFSRSTPVLKINNTNNNNARGSPSPSASSSNLLKNETSKSTQSLGDSPKLSDTQRRKTSQHMLRLFEKFKLKDQIVIGDWSCTLIHRIENKKSKSNGKCDLCLTQNYVCIYAVSFGSKIKEAICGNQIVHLSLDHSTERITMLCTKNRSYVFGSFDESPKTVLKYLKDLYQRYQQEGVNDLELKNLGKQDVGDDQLNEDDSSSLSDENDNKFYSKKLTEKEWHLILKGSKERFYKKGTCIIEKDTKPRCIYRIAHGKVKVVSPTGKTIRHLSADTEGIYSIIGEMSFLEDKGAVLSVVAMTDVVAYVLDAYYLYTFLLTYPKLAGKFYRYLGCVLASRSLIYENEGMIDSGTPKITQ
eukprot:TRINITY_DN2665_c0_g1_i3.p1 TRINITY_DN2665_c0_g1~~TRINITY_DN2665_c0_g1_i3.p1  ORF type:complete len:1305 (-),score=308.48 TRINITY_DN2665_c0_g1_i3:2146-6060(-)